MKGCSTAFWPPEGRRLKAASQVLHDATPCLVAPHTEAQASLPSPASSPSCVPGQHRRTVLVFCAHQLVPRPAASAQHLPALSRVAPLPSPCQPPAFTEGTPPVFTGCPFIFLKLPSPAATPAFRPKGPLLSCFRRPGTPGLQSPPHPQSAHLDMSSLGHPPVAQDNSDCMGGLYGKAHSFIHSFVF